jgi:hypothetical protein
MSYSVSLPSAFECSFVIKPLARSSANSLLYATDGSNDLLVGQYNSIGTNNGIWCGGSAHNTDTTTTLNTELTFIWRYENGVHTVSWDNHIVTTNCPQPTSLTKLSVDSNNLLKNIKIKPL